jgi:hypothetical protein
VRETAFGNFGKALWESIERASGAEEKGGSLPRFLSLRWVAEGGVLTRVRAAAIKRRVSKTGREQDQGMSSRVTDTREGVERQQKAHPVADDNRIETSGGQKGKDAEVGRTRHQL